MVTAIATLIYAVLFSIAVVFAYIQTKGFEKNRKREAASAVFKEIQTKEARDARKYIYKFMPMIIEGIQDDELQVHLEKAEEAIIAFDRIGYLLKEGHIDPDPILILAWSIVWRCGKKCENLIQWASVKRNDLSYLEHFRYLFNQSEVYRVANKLEEPRIY